MSENGSQDLEKFKQAAADGGAKVKHSAEELASQANVKVTDIVNNAKDSSGAVGSLTDKAAKKLSDAGNALKGADSRRILSDLESRIHDNPVSSTVIGFITGFIVCKLMSPPREK